MSELNFGTLRIRKYNPLNWVIESLEEVNVTNKETKIKSKVKKWKILGYYGNIESAFKRLPLKFLDKTQVNTLEEVKKVINGFRNDVLSEIKRIGDM